MKKFAKKILFNPFAYLLPLLVLAYIAVTPNKLQISNAQLNYKGEAEFIELPFARDFEDNSDFIVSFDLFLEKRESVRLSVIPDDCIKKIVINGNEKPLNGIKGICDYAKGTTINFSQDLDIGNNHIEFFIHNNGGPGGIKISQETKIGALHFAFSLILLATLFLILKKFKFGLRASFVVLLGVAIRLVFYSGVLPSNFGHDFGDHLKYIGIIEKETRLPNMDECWSCYHPPTYYIAGAAVKKVADYFNPEISLRVLQQAQLLFSFATLAFGVALLYRIFGKGISAFTSSLIFVLYPGFVLASARIGNDLPFYFCSVLCAYFAQMWWNHIPFHHPQGDGKSAIHRHSLYAFWATFGAALAFAFKSTGFVILGAWGIIFVFGSFRRFSIGSGKIFIASLLLVILFLGLSQYRHIENFIEGKKMTLVGNSSGLNSNLKVQNKTGNYIYFDFKDYLTEPYANPWKNEGGRQFFWNYALKTSLFGEFKVLDSHLGRTFASFINLFSLAIFALALWGVINIKLKEFPLLLFMLSLFAALIFARAQYPYSCSNDFRYIMPAILPISYFSLKGLVSIANGRLKILGYSCIYAFALLSLLFFVAYVILR